MRKQLKKIKEEKQATRYRRKLHIRNAVTGTAERPRICTMKTNKHLSVQIIDDSASKTIFAVQTYGKNAVPNGGKNVEGAKEVGKVIAEKMKAANITKAVFDRNGFKYTGAIAALADGIRKNGIQI